MPNTLLKITLSILLLVVFLPFLVSAATTDGFSPFGAGHGFIPCDGPPPANGQTPDPGYRVCDFNAAIYAISGFVKLIIYAIIPVSTIAFAYAGFLFMTAGDNSGQISKAKGIFWTVVKGTVITLAAWLIVNTIMTTLVKDPIYNSFLGK